MMSSSSTAFSLLIRSSSSACAHARWSRTTSISLKCRVERAGSCAIVFWECRNGGGLIEARVFLQPSSWNHFFFRKAALSLSLFRLPVREPPFAEALLLRMACSAAAAKKTGEERKSSSSSSSSRERDCFFSGVDEKRDDSLSETHFLSFFQAPPFSMVGADDNNAAAAASASQRVVVLDNGGCSIKLGFAGDPHPM